MAHAITDFLRSLKRVPNQSALDQVLRHTTRIVVVEGADGKAAGKTLLATDNPVDIATLRECLVIVTQDDGLDWVLCEASHTIKLYSDDGLLATIGVLNTFIRWRRWKCDARLVQGKRLTDWLTARGIAVESQPGC